MEYKGGDFLFKNIGVPTIIAITAIVSPVLVSLINNIFIVKRAKDDDKKNKADMSIQRRQDAIDDYLNCIVFLSTHTEYSYGSFLDYKRKLTTLRSHVSEEVEFELMIIDQLVLNKQSLLIEENIKKLANLLNKNKKRNVKK